MPNWSLCSEIENYYPASLKCSLSDLYDPSKRWTEYPRSLNISLHQIITDFARRRQSLKSKCSQIITNQGVCIQINTKHRQELSSFFVNCPLSPNVKCVKISFACLVSYICGQNKAAAWYLLSTNSDWHVYLKKNKAVAGDNICQTTWYFLQSPNYLVFLAVPYLQIPMFHMSQINKPSSVQAS